MNRKDKQRMDERRRESIGLKENHSDLSSSDASKSLMNSYFKSQQVIKSLLAKPVKTNDITKSFKIPKKIPAKMGTGRSTAENVDSCRSRKLPHRRTDPQNNKTFQSRRCFVDLSKRNALYCKRNVNDQKSRLDSERRQNNDVNTDKNTERIGKDSYNPKRIRVEAHHTKDRIEPQNPTGIESSRNDDDKPSLITVPLINKSKDPPGRNKTINLVITDRAAPNGKICPQNADLLFNKIEELVAKIILSDGKARFKCMGHIIDEGTLQIICGDVFSSIYFQNLVQKMPSLWPGASLECSSESYKRCYVELIVPKSINHISEFMDICKKTDSRMVTEKWSRRGLEHVESDAGTLYNLIIDFKSYEIIKEQGNYIRCGDTEIPILLQSISRF